MAVTVEIHAPISGTVFPLTILRPATTAHVTAGVGNYDIDFQWDTVTSFDSGNLITVSQNNVVAGEYSSVPTSDLDGGSTWYIRVVVDDLGDGNATSSTNTLTWFDPIDGPRHLYVAANVSVGFEGDPPTEGWRVITGSDPGDGDELDFDRFLYVAANAQIGFEGDPPPEGWRQITGSDPGDGDELDFDRFLYTAASVQIGFEGDPPPEGWRQITGSDPGDGDELDFDRFLYAAVNVFLGLEATSDGAAATGTASLSGGKLTLEALGGGHAASDGSGKLTRLAATGRFRLRRAVGGSTLQGGHTLQGVEVPPEVDLAGSGHAAADATAALTVEVGIAGSGDAAADADAAASVTRTLVGDGQAAGDADAAFTIQVLLSGDGHASSDGVGQLSVGNEEFLVGSGHAAGDASASLSLSFVLVGDGHAAGDADAVASVTRTLSGSGHAAGDATADLEEKTFLVGSGHAAADGTGALLLTRGLVGSGDAAADAFADLDVAVSASLSGSGHAASDGVGVLSVATIVPLVVNFALPAFTIAHNPAGLTSPPLVGGIVSPTSSQFAQFSSASAFATQTDAERHGVNYSPILRNRDRQVIGRSASGLLQLAPWNTTDPTDGNAYEIHFRPGDWMRTPNSPDYEVTTSLDIRVFGKFFFKNEFEANALFSKNQTDAIWTSDGDWMFFSQEHDEVNFLHKLAFSFWDNSGVRRNFFSPELPILFGFPARMGVRVLYEVGGGDTTVSFYYSILRSPATWVPWGTSSLGSEIPVRFTDDYIELGSHNAGDNIWNGDAPLEFYTSETGVKLNPIGHHGTINGVDMFVDGEQVIKMDAGMFGGNTWPGGSPFVGFGEVVRDSFATDSSGRRWEVPPAERETFNGEPILTRIDTHTRNNWNHNPSLVWEAFQPFPAWDDFGLHLDLTSGLT